MTANGSALLRYVMIISMQKLTQVIKSNAAAFLRIQRHNGKIIKRMLKRLLRLIKKDFLIDTSEDIRNKKCHSSLLADFKIGDKNMKTFLKGE